MWSFTFITRPSYLNRFFYGPWAGVGPRQVPLLPLPRAGNRAGRAGLGRANSGLSQNKARPKLARIFRAKILAVQPVVKTGQVGPNSIFKTKKIRASRTGPGHTGPSHNGLGQIWPDFFWTNNLMAQLGPNFMWSGLTHRIGSILPPLRPCLGPGLFVSIPFKNTKRGGVGLFIYLKYFLII